MKEYLLAYEVLPKTWKTAIYGLIEIQARIYKHIWIHFLPCFKVDKVAQSCPLSSQLTDNVTSTSAGFLTWEDKIEGCGELPKGIS